MFMSISVRLDKKFCETPILFTFLSRERTQIRKPELQIENQLCSQNQAAKIKIV